MLMQRNDQGWNADLPTFFKPFHWQLWVSVLLTYIFFSFTLKFLSNLGSKLAPYSSFQDEHDFSLRESFWYFSLVSIQLGVDKHPKSFSGKILVLAWSFFTLICIAAYTANLTAFYTDKSMIKPLKTIEHIPTYNHNVTTLHGYRAFLSQNNVMKRHFDENRVQYVAFVAAFKTKSGLDQLKKKILNDLHAGNVLIAHDLIIDFKKCV